MATPQKWGNEPSFDLGIEDSEDLSKLNVEDYMEIDMDLDMSNFDLNKLPPMNFGVKKKEVEDMIKIYLDYINCFFYISCLFGGRILVILMLF